jgi:hypothetical protein
LVVSVKGRPLGWFTSKVTRVNGALHLSDQLSLGEYAQQRTEIDFDRQGHLVRVQLGGRTTGISIRASLEYRRNRVRGVTVASTAGLLTDSANIDTTEVRSIAVPADTALPAGTIDDNAILFYLPALPWADRARFSLPVFFGQQNLIRNVTMTVLGRATVALRSGPVEAWEVEVGGSLAPVRYYISTASPHRLVQMDFTEAGIVYTLQD